MLQPGELDREAFFEVAHHPAGDLAERDEAPISGRSAAIAMPAPDSDRSMMRQADVGAVRQDQRAQPDCAARNGRGGGLPAG